MAVGVDVNNAGVPRVKTSENSAMLINSLFAESSACLTYVNLVAAAARYVEHLAKRSDLIFLEISSNFLPEVVAIFLVWPTRNSGCSVNERVIIILLVVFCVLSPLALFIIFATLRRR